MKKIFLKPIPYKRLYIPYQNKYIMNYKDHLKVGIATEILTIIILAFLIYYFSFAVEYNYMVVIALIIIIFISPLSPDLDHYSGKLREVWIGLGLSLGIYGMFFDSIYMKKGLILSVVPYVIPYLTSHRGFIHSIFFNIIYGGIIFYFTRNIYISIIGFVGFYSHLWVDKIPFKII